MSPEPDRDLPGRPVLTFAVTRLARLVPLALAALAAALPAPAAAADKPSAKTLYGEGPSGRFLVDGDWLFRLDAADQGLRQRFQRQTSTAGWSPVRVPHAWNVGDHSHESMRGSVGWYRKDFELPDARRALEWAVRFESVNYRSRVWLNGRDVGSNRGAYLPFTFRLEGLKRRGVNRLVVRVDSRRKATDFPPAGNTSTGVPTGGWWNYGGLLREVYLERLDTVQVKRVAVLPRLACRSCTAKVDFRVALENVASSGRRVSVSASFGGRPVGLGTMAVRRGGEATFTQRISVSSPRLWSPQRPSLYPVTIRVRAGGRQVASYSLKTGVRSLRVAGGRLYLNGRAVNIRGFGIHEDNRAQGFAVDNAFRDRLVAEARAAGGSMLRTHYPMHPYVHELADRQGLLIWSEIPVYALKTTYLARESVRAAAVREMRKNVETNLNHPSVMIWSVANELSSRPGPAQGNYIARAARVARELDGTRPVGLAFAGYPSAGCQGEYRTLDVIGVNDYFGWYPGPNGSLFDRTRLSDYLDQVRRCYPSEAIMVTEFGAEANRDGPAEEKGTWAHQQEFVNFHLGVFAQKPWLSGALYWALNEFRVKPAWEGGNPRPQSPIHQKGLITYDGLRKPAFADVQRGYTQTDQFGTR